MTVDTFCKKFVDKLEQDHNKKHNWKPEEQRFIVFQELNLFNMSERLKRQFVYKWKIPPRDQKLDSRELLRKSYIKTQQLKSEARQVHLTKYAKQIFWYWRGSGLLEYQLTILLTQKISR